MTLKTVVFTAMPRARVTIPITAKAGFFASVRRANRMSPIKLRMGGLSKQTLATVAPHLGCLKSYGRNPLKVPQLAISGAAQHDAPCPLLGFKVSLTNMLRWMEQQVYLGTHFWRSKCSQ